MSMSPCGTGPGSRAAADHPWLFTSDGGGPYGYEEIWSTTAITPQNTGVNVNYDVPSGSGAWFVAAGGGPGACPPDVSQARGYAVTYLWEVSGQITYAYTNKPAVGVTVTADCPSGGTTTTDANGDYRFLLDTGPCTIVPTAPDGLGTDPEKRVVDVEGNINNVNFEVYATLYFAVKNGLSVRSNFKRRRRPYQGWYRLHRTGDAKGHLQNQDRGGGPYLPHAGG